MGESEDARLFDALYAEQQGLLYAYLLGQTGDGDVAADLLQETFVRTWRHIATVSRMAANRRKPWLLAVARNLIIDHRRKRSSREGCEATMPAEIAGGEPADREFHEKDVSARIDMAIRNLPEELRTPLTMSVMEEMTSEAIGRVLGRPAGTVRYQISEARKRLAQEVGL